MLINVYVSNTCSLFSIQLADRTRANDNLLTTVVRQLQPHNTHEAEIQSLMSFLTMQLLGVHPSLRDEVTNSLTQVVRHFRQETRRIVEGEARQRERATQGSLEPPATPQQQMQPQVPISRPPRNITPQQGPPISHQEHGYQGTMGSARALYMPQGEQQGWATPGPQYGRQTAVPRTPGPPPTPGSLLNLPSHSMLNVEGASPSTSRLLDSLLQTPTQE